LGDDKVTTELIFSCGTGGVGKTTCSALLGISLALQGKDIMLVTIDPARRLADSLHISLQANESSTVPLPNCSGSLEAMMLDAAAIFHSSAEELTSKEEFQLLSQNRYFEFARDKMGGIQEYMAILQVMKLVHSKKYDIIIIDTPPTRNAIEFLESPERLEHLFSSKGLQWLSSSSGLGALSIGKSLVGKGLRRFLGSETITDMTEFFSLFQTVAQELKKSSQECLLLMKSPKTHFWIITTTEQQKPAELLSFIEYLKKNQFQLFGLLLNKYPSALLPLTKEQQKHMSQDPELSQTISWIQQENQTELNIATQQVKLLHLDGLPKYYLPKSQMHNIEDMVYLANILTEQNI
jgi:arsenite-transporting ATPase